MLNRQRSDAVLLPQCRSCAGAGAAGWRWVRSISRRAMLGGLAGVALAPAFRTGSAQSTAPAFSYPIGIPGRPLGDGFIVRHGYACENTIVQPGWLHTAEDWYLTEGEETGGSRVYAVAPGEVVFAGYDYPGLVIIVQHAPDLYSSYGHLNYDGLVQPGDLVERGQLIGTVQTRVGRRVPSHLHFELRTFLINPVVNGENPSYGVHCGLNCPPGPGYWPMAAPEHPTAMGWRNPTHVINHRAYDGGILLGADVVATAFAGAAVPLWSDPPGQDGASITGELAVTPSDRFRLLAIAVGPEGYEQTSAGAYHLWYRIIVPGGERAWVQAALPSTHDTGSDGRPSSVIYPFLMDAPAE